MEMKDLEKEETATPISRLKYDMDNGTLKSRNRQGWAPPKAPSREETQTQRPVSFSGIQREIFEFKLKSYH